jgi:hypothetical protein
MGDQTTAEDFLLSASEPVEDSVTFPALTVWESLFVGVGHAYPARRPARP